MPVEIGNTPTVSEYHTLPFFQEIIILKKKITFVIAIGFCDVGSRSLYYSYFAKIKLHFHFLFLFVPVECRFKSDTWKFQIRYCYYYYSNVASF